MGYRRFVDRQGRQWEVRDRSQFEWDLEPVGGNPGRRAVIRPPAHESDPFDVSETVLQRLLDEQTSRGADPRKSPFKD